MRFRLSPVLLVLACLMSSAYAPCGVQDDDTGTPAPTAAPTATPTAAPTAAPTPTAPPVVSNTDQIAAELAAAVDGLYFMSESDYPFTVVTVAGAATEPLTADNIKTAIAPVYVNRPDQATLEERYVEVRTLDQFFHNLVTPQDWWDDYNYQQAVQYTELQDILANEVGGAQYFRLGEHIDANGYVSGSVDVYLVGASNTGDLIGVWTISIET